MTLDIQRELVDQKMQLKDTKAGKEVLTEVEQQRQEYQQKVQELEAKVQRLEEACERGNKSWRNTVEEFEELKERKELAEQKLARTHEDTLKLQATHDQIMAEQKRHYEQLLQQQQGKQSLNLDQVGEEERKKFRENYRREMRRMCILM
jgi:uncharacterized protein YjcR